MLGALGPDEAVAGEKAHPVVARASYEPVSAVLELMNHATGGFAARVGM
jgi:hypothetical protein